MYSATRSPDSEFILTPVAGFQLRPLPSSCSSSPAIIAFVTNSIPEPWIADLNILARNLLHLSCNSRVNHLRYVCRPSLGMREASACLTDNLPPTWPPLQLFRRLARAFKRSSVPTFEAEGNKSVSSTSRLTRTEKTLHKRSATCLDTPDWLCTPITAQSTIPLRTPPNIACPSESSIINISMKSPASASWKKTTFGRTADAARRRMSKSTSQVQLQRNDSVLSFASADAFGKANLFDNDDEPDMVYSIPSTSSSSPRDVQYATYHDAQTVRRTRSNTDSSNYSLPSSFNYRTPSLASPRSASSSSSQHRTKNSEDTIYTEDTGDSEVLMTCQMVESAYQARRSRSRPPSLVKIRRSFSDERSAYGKEAMWV